MDFSDIAEIASIANLAAALTFILGLGFFVFPSNVLSHLRLEGVEHHFEAFGEGRSSFAGFLITIGILCLAIGDTISLFVLAACWLIASSGKVLHILLDHSRRLSVFLRLLFSVLVSSLLLVEVDIPNVHLIFPGNFSTLLPAISAAITVLFGLLCFVFPTTSLHLMRLRPKDTHPDAKGEVRGTLAGFYLGVGGAVLLVGGFIPTLLLGLSWAMTAFGRIISMLSDRSNNGFNWLSLLLEFVLAGLPLGVLLGLLG